MNFDKPLIPLGTESLDGRIIQSVSIDLERGPLPVYGRDRLLVGKVTSVTVDANGVVSVSGQMLEDPVNSLAADMMLDLSLSPTDGLSGELRGVSISDDPAFVFEEDEKT